MKPEQRVVKAVLAEIKRRGGKAVKTQPPGVEAGTPDILAALNGVCLAVECKAPNCKASPLQLRRLAEWNAAGAVAVVVDDVRKFVAMLDAMRL